MFALTAGPIDENEGAPGRSARALLLDNTN